MNPAAVNRTTTGEPKQYAPMSDLCKLFVEEMSSLYHLSFLLTGDHDKAEQCFVAGADDSMKGNPIFKEWARAWAKRMIVVNAIRVVVPRPHYAGEPALAIDLEPDNELHVAHDKGAIIASVLALADFERFVFVLSVLERYPDKDCSALLGCSLQEIRETRARALVQVAQSYAERASLGLEALTH